jgi:hypothetical protein
MHDICSTGTSGLVGMLKSQHKRIDIFTEPDRNAKIHDTQMHDILILTEPVDVSCSINHNLNARYASCFMNQWSSWPMLPCSMLLHVMLIASMLIMLHVSISSMFHASFHVMFRCSMLISMFQCAHVVSCFHKFMFHKLPCFHVSFPCFLMSPHVSCFPMFHVSCFLFMLHVSCFIAHSMLMFHISCFMFPYYFHKLPCVSCFISSMLHKLHAS